MNRRLAQVLALGLVILTAELAKAEERKDSFEVSEFISYADFAPKTRLKGNAGAGLRLGYNFNSWLEGELSYHRSENAKFTKLSAPSVDVEEVQAVAILNWKRKGKKFQTRFQPYMILGFGHADYNPPAGEDFRLASLLSRKEGLKTTVYQKEAAHEAGGSTEVWGFGSKFYFNEALALRLDLRLVRSIDSSFTNFEPNLGLSFSLGGGPPGKDSDGDGVVDYQDDCPGTPKGAVVGDRGCPIDSDGDGVPDGIDQCPDTPKGVVVDTKGCPVDSDGDGVPDGPDQCPNTPKGAKVDEKGCPIDSDADGVPDGIDQCPDTPKGAKVDEKGCPIDSDADGVPDGIDQCPDTPKGAKVDEKGCPIDSDADGVPDGIDQCPDTPPGVKVDKKGCPLVKPLFEKDQRSIILKGVTFDSNKATLTPESLKILDDVAASLLSYPGVRIEVKGYTDSTGGPTRNQKLSESRANAVRDYLISKGVPAERIAARGYGQSNPIATNATPEGRAQNRRVELARVD